MARETRATVFKISGMDCADEVAVLKSAVGPIAGGTDRLAFDLLNGRMVVTPMAGAVVSHDAVVAAVAQTGMRADVWRDTPGPRRQESGKRSRIVLTAVSGGLTAAGFLVHLLSGDGTGAALGGGELGGGNEVPWVARVLYGAAVVTGARFVAPRAWYALRRLRPDMNLLMTIAVAGAMLIGEWFEAATVAFLFSLSLTLEAWSVGRARRAIEALLKLAPNSARLITADGEHEIPAEQVPIGSRFVVRPGERIALDGQVTAGSSHVNQAPITGESAPVEKQPGATVFAGTINGDGAIEVVSTKSAGDTTLAHIIELVGDAQSRRSPSEQWVERFARVYTPAVMATAVVVALAPAVLAWWTWSDSLYASLALLVIGCPCALVISTPVTIVAALAASARQGVLVKGGEHMEAPAHLEVVALDKTGTLTRGQPVIVAALPLNGHSEDELVARAAALESRSDHPLARAVVECARSRGISPPPVDEFRIIQGKGATGLVAGRRYWLGSHRYLEERGQETPAVHLELERLSQAGHSVVVVGNEDHVCGMLAAADELRPEARQAIAALRDAGVSRVVMLTGDNRATAELIGRQAGVDDVRAELLPADKVAVIEELVGRWRTVAMVGDGVNDAPAMARASVGIAMGAAGTDAAIETADIALMADDLSKLPWLVAHARRAVTVIRQNIAVALGVKLLFVGLTLSGHASLWGAIAADMGVSLLVIANALRLLPGSGSGIRAGPPAGRAS
jgi:Cd2+/Zn2+-exporting ATPase